MNGSWFRNRRFRWRNVGGPTVERLFPASLLVLIGPFRVLPLALYYPCTLKTYCTVFSAAAICILFTCLTNSASASHISHAYSRLGTITFVRIQNVILVSRCESAWTASIFYTCDLPFGNTFVSCVVHDRSFEVFKPRCACWSTISRSSSQSSILLFSRFSLSLLNIITAHALTLDATNPFLVYPGGFSIRSCKSQGVSGERRFKTG